MTSNLLRLTLFAPALILLSGCAYFTEQKKERELEMVARRWCMTMRASQIIPIYPLNEDIQPGDVFVVDTPAERQASDYNKRGYLSLDHLVMRLKTSAYPDFYSKSYNIGDSTDTPHHWQFPTNTWTNAPMAGFPTYSVDVKKGGGFNAAFPISGIPVGLSYVGSAQAKVSVQLAKAHTFGLDKASLEPSFRAWLKTNDLVSQFARPIGQTAYLRLITRVFLVESVNVTVTGDDASGFSASGGVAKKVNIPILQDTNAIANYTNSVSKLAEMVEGLSESAPGGTLKLSSASSHSISMNETFARPLVIGYLAQDYPIFPNGSIRGPISTKDVIEKRVDNPIELSSKSLFSEQKAAKPIADESIGRLSLMTPDELVKTLPDAVKNGILSENEKNQVLGIISQRPDQAKSIYFHAIQRKSRAGNPNARTDLHKFSNSIKD
jgi:hypothetical protein